uniref:Uncharacterized protein n=1 Tax=Ditylenchus dipsaci TaxID=166011 RepID=A0A915D054_9BILA
MDCGSQNAPGHKSQGSSTWFARCSLCSGSSWNQHFDLFCATWLAALHQNGSMALLSFAMWLSHELRRIPK